MLLSARDVFGGSTVSWEIKQMVLLSERKREWALQISRERRVKTEQTNVSIEDNWCIMVGSQMSVLTGYLKRVTGKRDTQFVTKVVFIHIKSL